MSLPIVDIGDAIVAAIQAYRVDLDPDHITRRYVTQQDLGDVATLIITVIPSSEETGPVTRGSVEKKYTFLIVFQHKMTGGTDASRTEQVDGLLEAVQDLMDELDWTAMADAKWTGEITRDNLLERDSDKQMNQFMAAFTVQYVKHIARA